MQLSPFSAFYIARKLECLSNDDNFISVFSSSNIKIYPFQIAAAHFALRSPYQKGVILCDESGMGKSHETMLIVLQRWFEGKTKILIAIPNLDLLVAWENLINNHYSIEVVNAHQRNSKGENENVFEFDGIVLATYDYIAKYSELVSEINWDIIVFEEATALSTVYQKESKTANILKNISKDAFKILLTGTPIEKNIMDLYGLIYFIDDSILESEEEFMKKYLRKPENYEELSNRVSKIAFRTLKKQAKEYAKITKRIAITYEYTLSENEQILYNNLFSYCNRENKIAYPQINNYDLSLKLLEIISSSTSAILYTLNNIKERLEEIKDTSLLCEEELTKITQMIDIAKSIKIDSKVKSLLDALEIIFKICKKTGADKKVLIFTHSTQTQKYLYEILKKIYKTSVYNGTSTYKTIEEFKKDLEILISTDIGARGFNIEECSVIIQYDLLYNTLKMEQRIDRVHRIGQENDVIVLSFINKNNFSDVRKLELINKRMFLADGVLGISDYVVGGFTNELEKTLTNLINNTRTKREVEYDYQNSLTINEEKNKNTIAVAEEKLFTTFTKEIRDKIKISPKYIELESERAIDNLWEISKYYFENYNKKDEECKYEIDDKKRIISVKGNKNAPTLFYYWNGRQNIKYKGKKQYGIDKNYKPTSNKITFTSIIGRGIINEIECGNRGEIIVSNTQNKISNCTIALYSVIISNGITVPLLVGRETTGKVLTHKECENILMCDTVSYKQDEKCYPAWLKTSSQYDKIDNLVDVETIIEERQNKLNDVQQEEIEKIKLKLTLNKTSLEKEIIQKENEITQINIKTENENINRLEMLKINKEKNKKILELKQKKDMQFFEQMQLEVQAQEEIDNFLGKEKLTAKAVRQFVVTIHNG